MNAPRRRVGLFGGSFNPVHAGHMMLAQWIVEFTQVDEVWLMLSPSNPLKEGREQAADIYRMDMLRLACADTPGVEASDFELKMPRPSYTASTLRNLQTAFPEFEFQLIIGADNWLQFHMWRDWQEILHHHRVMVYPRPGYDIDTAALPPGVVLLEQAPQCNVSSTMLRRAIAEGKCMNRFMPCGVYNYIVNHNLYK